MIRDQYSLCSRCLPTLLELFFWKFSCFSAKFTKFAKNKKRVNFVSWAEKQREFLNLFWVLCHTFLNFWSRSLSEKTQEILQKYLSILPTNSLFYSTLSKMDQLIFEKKMWKKNCVKKASQFKKSGNNP